MVDGQRLLSPFSHPSPYLSLSLELPGAEEKHAIEIYCLHFASCPALSYPRIQFIVLAKQGALSPKTHSHSTDRGVLILATCLCTRQTHTHTHPSPKLLHLPGRSNTPRDSCWLHCFHMWRVEVNAYRLTAFYRHMRTTDTT